MIKSLLAKHNISKDTILSHILIRGSKRTKTVKKNAYLSLGLMVSIIVGILFVPV